MSYAVVGYGAAKNHTTSQNLNGKKSNMGYRVVGHLGATDWPYGPAPVPGQMSCENSGGRWDAGIGGCICPAGKLFDSQINGCAAERDLSYAAKREYESGGKTSGGTPEPYAPSRFEITAKEQRQVSGTSWIILGLLGIGAVAIVGVTVAAATPFEDEEVSFDTSLPWE